MATNTYVALDLKTATSAVSSITFTSIPSTYTDLVVVVSGQVSSNVTVACQVNGDTSTNYSTTEMFGDVTAASSFRSSTNAQIAVMGIGAQVVSGSEWVSTLNFQNYANTTTYKTILGRTSAAGTGVNAIVGLWRSTSAISSITILGYAGASGFTTGTTFALYGIQAVSSGTNTAKATGGTITYDDFYAYHTFTATGNFVPSTSVTCDVLIVGGGGGADADISGGGGAGGLRVITDQIVSSSTTATIGGGGAGGIGTGGPGAQSVGASGTDSSFGSLVATGGGRGVYGGANGAAGGSGGGSRATTAGTGNAGGLTPPEGYSGAVNTNAVHGGGGGGAGGAGSTGGTGGPGANSYGSMLLTNWLTTTSTGSSGYLAGGGGGTRAFSGSTYAGGIGGGGTGAADQTAGGNGVANTGSGGGGGGYANSTPALAGNGGSGGNGLIIVRYLKA